MRLLARTDLDDEDRRADAHRDGEGEGEDEEAHRDKRINDFFRIRFLLRGLSARTVAP